MPSSEPPPTGATSRHAFNAFLNCGDLTSMRSRGTRRRPSCGSGKSRMPLPRMHCANFSHSCWSCAISAGSSCSPGGSFDLHACCAFLNCAEFRFGPPAGIWNLPFLSGSGKAVSPFSRMHWAYLTAFSTVELAFDPDELDFASPEPPHPVTARASAAADAASDTERFMPPLKPEGRCGGVCGFRYARDTPNRSTKPQEAAPRHGGRRQGGI